VWVVSLISKSRSTQVFNLDHDLVCGEDACFCATIEQKSVAIDRDGNQGYRTADKQICGSVHLLPGATSEGLPDGVRSLPTVAAAVARGDLVVKEIA
jgi:hypothetical protein